MQPITSAKFSPDGNMVITASLDGNAHVYETLSAKLKFQLMGHQMGIVSTSLHSYDKCSIDDNHDCD